MPVRLKVFVPPGLVANVTKLARAVANGLDGAALGAQVDFQVTTSTWDTSVAFDISAPSAESRVVGTDNTIYGYVNDGTRPHVIVPHGKALAFPAGGFRPKSRPGFIGANRGSKGSGQAFAKRVNHPGTQARKFDQAIAKKWREQLPVIMQRAIDSEV